MKLIRTEDAVGHVLCQDITQIIKDQVKDAVFRKGHVVTEADIPVLLSVGKRNLYVWENDERMLHENEGAKILCDICRNTHMNPSEIKEGKIELRAEIDGVFWVDTDRLQKINRAGEVMIATRYRYMPVEKGDKLAGMRVIPLVIAKEKMKQVKKLAGEKPLLALHPYHQKKVGIVTTGSEVYSGIIKDTFGPVIREKLEAYPTEVLGQTIVDDQMDMIKAAIADYLSQGADMVVCTGGMSVDPDDVTPGAIKAAADRFITYGAPALPGAMLALAYKDREGDKVPVPIVGLPGCVMYAERTIFDLVLPRLLADIPITEEEIGRLGNGGLCMGCAQCHFPNCGFGASVS